MEKTTKKKAADTYTKEEMSNDIQDVIDELDGIVTDLLDIRNAGREEKTKKPKDEIVQIDGNGEIELSRDMLQTLGVKRGSDMKIVEENGVIILRKA